MKTARKTLMLVALAAMTALAGCSVRTSGRIDVHASDLRYVRDGRTGLCFAITASREEGRVNTTGIAMAHVPCSKKVLAQIGRKK